MPNASDDWGYDPIDGKPSITDSPPPYSVLPDILLSQERFIAALGKAPYPETVPEEIRVETGRALYHFILDIQQVQGNPDEKTAEEQLQKLTDKLFGALETTHEAVFKDRPVIAYDLLKAMPEASPFVIVYGKARIRIADADEYVTVDWIVQNVLTPERVHQQMGQLVRVGISEAMDALNPGMMAKQAAGELTLDEVLEALERSIVQKS